MAANDKKSVIVIKKIYQDGGAGHGGAWKVAFADFMTAMMCFFLVMWLLNQSEETKAQVASYFTGPSMIEHEFTSYGAELTLEKLFLDLINEPLKAVQEFMQPVDFTPNLMAMGSKRIVLLEIAEELGAVAKNVNVESDRVTFEIPDKVLFKRGTADPNAQFLEVMSKIQGLTKGLENSTVDITSNVLVETVAGNDAALGKRISNQRLDLIKNKIRGSLDHDTVDIIGTPQVKKLTRPNENASGTVVFEISQKDLPDGRKPRPLEEIFEKRKGDLNVYDDFVRRVSQDKRAKNTKAPPKKKKTE